MKLSIALPLATYPDGPPADAVARAVALARSLDARIAALVQEVVFPIAANRWGNTVIDVAAMAADARHRATERGAVASQELRAALPDGCDVTKVTSFPGLFGGAAAEHARYHDLSVVPFGGTDGVPAQIAEELAFGSGRPVVLLPPGLAVPSLQHVAIAWDGSAVAARALALAAPLLDRATSFTILTITDEKPLPAGDVAERLASALTSRGVPVRVQRVAAPRRHVPTGILLQDEARAAGADTLLMGAFGHSRLRDFVLGGATRDVLQEPRIAMIMAH